jgi:hypothetical protein
MSSISTIITRPSGSQPLLTLKSVQICAVATGGPCVVRVARSPGRLSPKRRRRAIGAILSATPDSIALRCTLVGFDGVSHAPGRLGPIAAEVRVLCPVVPSGVAAEAHHSLLIHPEPTGGGGKDRGWSTVRTSPSAAHTPTGRHKAAPQTQQVPAWRRRPPIPRERNPDEARHFACQPLAASGARRRRRGRDVRRPVSGQRQPLAPPLPHAADHARGWCGCERQAGSAVGRARVGATATAGRWSAR